MSAAARQQVQGSGGHAPERERFAHVDTWVFDLDNTLYPPHCDLWPRIDMRITQYMCALFGLDGMSCRALQKYYYRAYGTTMHGLIEEHGITPSHYLDFVHDIDRSDIDPDHALAEAIAALPGRRLILTNGSRDHALKTADRLGLAGLFEDVFDIVAADLVPKPHPQVYAQFFARHGVDPRRAVLFEDIERNLVTPHESGMVTVLVTPKQGGHDHREDWEIFSKHPPHVDYVTDDLPGFLRTLRP